MSKKIHVCKSVEEFIDKALCKECECIPCGCGTNNLDTSDIDREWVDMTQKPFHNWILENERFNCCPSCGDKEFISNANHGVLWPIVECVECWTQYVHAKESHSIKEKDRYCYDCGGVLGITPDGEEHCSECGRFTSEDKKDNLTIELEYLEKEHKAEMDRMQIVLETVQAERDGSIRIREAADVVQLTAKVERLKEKVGWYRDGIRQIRTFIRDGEDERVEIFCSDTLSGSTEPTDPRGHEITTLRAKLKEMEGNLETEAECSAAYQEESVRARRERDFALRTIDEIEELDLDGIGIDQVIHNAEARANQAEAAELDITKTLDACRNKLDQVEKKRDRYRTQLEEAATAAASGKDPKDYLATRLPTTLQDEIKTLKKVLKNIVYDATADFANLDKRLWPIQSKHHRIANRLLEKD